MGESVVVTRGVRKDFGDQTILDGVDVDVGRNEVTLLMGPNGAGKTVLLSCIAGGLTPTEGDISVLGMDPDRASTQLSFMLQGELASPDLTGRENAEFYRQLHPRAGEHWAEFVDVLGIADDLDRPVREYSGGMERKLELALTMSVNVPLYLLDEPTSELDRTAINQFHSIVRKALDRGRTVLMTSHVPSDIELADRIVFVQHGRAVAAGRPDDLQENLPRVIEVESRQVGAALADLVHDDRFFEVGGRYRGFLRSRVTIDEVRATVLDAFGKRPVSIETPNHDDLFNYYTRILPNRDR